MNEEIDINTLHNILIDNLVEKELIISNAVEAAFRTIPRHPFLPKVSPEKVYSNVAIPTHFDENGLAVSSSSQPAIMAIMLEQLALQPGQRVLEIGAGTGYNAALMAYLVGDLGQVTTIDIDPEIVDAAREHLTAIGRTNVTVICGDGMDGFPGNAPYDVIILTVGGWEIAPPWLEQLKPDGRILLPLSLNGPQFSIAFVRENEGLTSLSIAPCGFMSLRGPHAEPRSFLPLNEEKTIHLGKADGLTEQQSVGVQKVNDWLATPATEVGTGLQVAPIELWQGFLLWMSLHEPHLIDLSARDDGRQAIPPLLTPSPAGTMTVGLVGEGGMAFFEQPPGWSPPKDTQPDDPARAFELHIRSYGSAAYIVEQLHQQALDWDENGRPGAEGMRVHVIPIDSEREGSLTLQRRWHKFIIDWPDI